jgi:CreA protein
MKNNFMISLLLLACGGSAVADMIGSVDTEFRFIGPDNKIVIEAFDDPEVAGVTCYISRAKTGGVSGAAGVAEDTSDASLSCHQTGAVNLDPKIKTGERDGENVFKKRTSLIFKSMQVVRFYDKNRNTLVYMVYSDRVLKGSPKNSISAVPILPWRSG